MSISELFIRRPIMTTLVMSAILIFGLFAYMLLPVSDLPNVDFPTIQVSASLPGASPETMASSVATPLEKQFATIAGIDSMTSTNTLGQSNITIQFNLSRSLDGAALDVQSAISKAGGQLPPQMPTPTQLVREVEVMEDSVDRLHDLHGYATHPHSRATRSAHSSSVGSDGSGTAWCLPVSTLSIAAASAAVIFSGPPVRTVAQGVSSRMSDTPDSRCSSTGIPRCRLSIAGMP